LGVGFFLHIFSTWIVEKVGLILIIVGLYNSFAKKFSKIHPVLNFIITIILVSAYLVFLGLLTGDYPPAT